MAETLKPQDLLQPLRVGVEAARTAASVVSFMGNAVLQRPHIRHRLASQEHAREIASIQSELKTYQPERANDDFREKIEFSTAMLVQAVRKSTYPPLAKDQPMPPAAIETVWQHMMETGQNPDTIFTLLNAPVARQLMHQVVEMDVRGMDFSSPGQSQQLAGQESAQIIELASPSPQRTL